MKLSKYLVGVLVASTLTWILGGTGPAKPLSVCRYSVGVVLQIPGYNCPAVD